MLGVVSYFILGVYLRRILPYFHTRHSCCVAGSAMSTGAPPSASLLPEVLTVEDGGRVMTDTDLTQQNATTS